MTVIVYLPLLNGDIFVEQARKQNGIGEIILIMANLMNGIVGIVKNELILLRKRNLILLVYMILLEMLVNAVGIYLDLVVIKTKRMMLLIQKEDLTQLEDL